MWSKEEPELDRVRARARDTYDLVGPKYHELFHNEMQEKDYDRRLLEDFASHLGTGAVVLDVGCGPSGHIARYLHDRGLDVRGIDISPVCVAMACSLNPGMQFAVGDLTRLTLPDDSADGIVSYYSIIHTPRKYQNRIFAEFRRVLKVGGNVLVVVKKGDDEGYVDELIGAKTKVYFTHFREEDIRKYLLDNGFRVTFMETRSPYEFEISDARIYAIGEKID